MRSWAVHVTIFSNGSIILTGFKFTKLHTLTLATHSYALLLWGMSRLRKISAGCSLFLEQRSVYYTFQKLNEWHNLILVASLLNYQTTKFSSYTVFSLVSIFIWLLGNIQEAL